jgi:DNA polymerase-3 subunit gamma/tau
MPDFLAGQLREKSHAHADKGMPPQSNAMSDLTPASGEYVVVARRYRPQTFESLIGQEHVAQALQGAIASERVGHAYLFTGARGVGKTSAARILAKCLNCERGTSPTPCGECEICQSIAAGDDVDVIEIDGASNRGIDEIRQLRQNVAVRPSRSRFKIYIIDEVHMLTKEAFNALLKTLEEPPEHVKFIFATTEANKIPITILSRCQRYDFAGIDSQAIHARLAEIAEAEGVAADSDALSIIAIRAAGSMRDSQSLLEQLLSTGAARITSNDVTGLLGLAPAARLSRLVEPLVEHDAATALTEFDATIAEGAEPGQLIDQLLGYFRDVLTQAVGCGESQLLYALPAQREEIRSVAERLGVETLLAISQVLDQAAARMRVSTQVRTLAEMALVRICRLQNLDDLASLVAQVVSGEVREASPASSGIAKKNGIVNPTAVAPTTPAPRPPVPVQSAPRSAISSQPLTIPESSAKEETSTPTTCDPPADSGTESATSEAVALDAQSVEPIWKRTLDRLTGLVAESAAAASRLSVDGQGRLVASFPTSRKFLRDTCLRQPALGRIESALAEVCGGRVSLVLTTHEEAPGETTTAPVRPSAKQQLVETANQPFVKRAMELFEGDPSRMRVVPPASS